MSYFNEASKFRFVTVLLIIYKCICCYYDLILKDFLGKRDRNVFPNCCKYYSNTWWLWSSNLGIIWEVCDQSEGQSQEENVPFVFALCSSGEIREQPESDNKRPASCQSFLKRILKTKTKVAPQIPNDKAESKQIMTD